MEINSQSSDIGNFRSSQLDIRSQIESNANSIDSQRVGNSSIFKMRPFPMNFASTIKKQKQLVTGDSVIEILRKIPKSFTPWTVMDVLDYADIRILCKYKGVIMGAKATKLSLSEKVYQLLKDGAFGEFHSEGQLILPSLNCSNLAIPQCVDENPVYPDELKLNNLSQFDQNISRLPQNLNIEPPKSSTVNSPTDHPKAIISINDSSKWTKASGDISKLLSKRTQEVAIINQNIYIFKTDRKRWKQCDEETRGILNFDVPQAKSREMLLRMRKIGKFKPFDLSMAFQKEWEEASTVTNNNCQIFHSLKKFRQAENDAANDDSTQKIILQVNGKLGKDMNIQTSPEKNIPLLLVKLPTIIQPTFSESVNSLHSINNHPKEAMPTTTATYDQQHQTSILASSSLGRVSTALSKCIQQTDFSALKVIKFDTLKLGLVLTKVICQDGSEIAIIRSKDLQCLSPEISRLLCVGDQLVTIDGITIEKSQSFSFQLDLLKQQRRPIILGFVAGRSERMMLNQSFLE